MFTLICSSIRISRFLMANWLYCTRTGILTGVLSNCWILCQFMHVFNLLLIPLQLYCLYMVGAKQPKFTKTSRPLGCACFAEILSQLTKNWISLTRECTVLIANLQCKSVKIYRAQNPQYLVLSKISAKQGQPFVESPMRQPFPPDPPPQSLRQNHSQDGHCSGQ